MKFEPIKSSYELIKSGTVKRIDGDGFIIYKAGDIIRIDIKEEKWTQT